MQFTSKAQFIRVSPYKLRPFADAIRGKRAIEAVQILQTTPLKRVEPMKKLLQSAISNAKNMEPEALIVKEIRVDEGPMYRYFKPGAMGRSNIYKKRTCHMKIILEPINKEKEV